jgi:hypothetical protein
MTPPVISSAPRVKKALLEKIEAEQATTFKGVQIRYAHPGVTIQQEAIYFGKVILHETARAMGRKRREEDYDLEVIVDVAQDGDEAQPAEERCWALVAALEELLRPIPELPSGSEPSGVVTGWVVWSSVEMTPYIEAGQRLAEAVCKIAVKHLK